MLHSIDQEGRILGVSDYWLEVMGYRREDVIGQNLTDFYTESSLEYAENFVFPEFFPHRDLQGHPLSTAYRRRIGHR